MSRTFRDRSYAAMIPDHFRGYYKGWAFRARLDDGASTIRDTFDALALVRSGRGELVRGSQARPVIREVFRSSNRSKRRDFAPGYAAFVDGDEVVIVRYSCPVRKAHYRDNFLREYKGYASTRPLNRFKALNFRDFLEDATD